MTFVSKISDDIIERLKRLNSVLSIEESNVLRFQSKSIKRVKYLFIKNSTMMYLYALLYLSIMSFTIQDVTSKNHFKGKFLKDLVKIKRLAQFRNSLCSEIDDMLKNSESQLLRYI